MKNPYLTFLLVLCMLCILMLWNFYTHVVWHLVGVPHKIAAYLFAIPLGIVTGFIIQRLERT